MRRCKRGARIAITAGTQMPRMYSRSSTYSRVSVHFFRGSIRHRQSAGTAAFCDDRIFDFTRFARVRRSLHFLSLRGADTVDADPQTQHSFLLPAAGTWVSGAPSLCSWKRGHVIRSTGLSSR